MRKIVIRATHSLAQALGTSLIVMSLAACSGEDGSSSTGPSAPLSIAGVWNYSETLNDDVHDISCNNAGTLNVNQTGSSFSGSFTQEGVCTGPGGSIDNSGSGTISGGQIDGNDVSFNADFCQYTGTISGSPPNRITGSGSCTVQEAGETFNFTSSFQASR